ncbi:hypothetical protein [Nostoc sp.]|uniref:hypothetical protein n=1 Tax=Nostoc sp. TaxID=1180 RepID=UPI003592F4CC
MPQRFHQFLGKDFTTEYFYGDNGAGLGINQQTAWTGLVATINSLQCDESKYTTFRVGENRVTAP